MEPTKRSKERDHEGYRYDAIAHAFAEMRVDFYAEQPYLDLLCDSLPEGASILDVGCGSGVPIAAYLISKNHQVTGIDASQALLAIAREKCPTMTTQHGDIRDLSLTKTFDGIIEWWCLFHLPKEDQIKMIKRFATWLKPGGLLQFTTGSSEFESENADMLNQPLRFYSCDPKQYEDALQANQFQLLFCESDQPGHLVWMAKRLG